MVRWCCTFWSVLLLGTVTYGFVVQPSLLKSTLFHPGSTQLHLFSGLFGGKKSQKNNEETSGTAVAKVDSERVQQLKGKLEKISRTQNRDYEAEAKSSNNYGRNKPVEIRDKQGSAFNFNKPNEFPNLYKGWIKADGDQIAKQMISSAKAALGAKEKYIEVLFDPVPNLDEVAFGTVWNKKLRMEVAANLQVPDYATNRGGPATLEWSNLYWANRLAAGLSNFKIVALTISGEGTKGQFLPKLANGMRLVTMQDAKRGALDVTGSPTPTLIFVLSPCQDSHYKDAMVIGEKYNAPVIALNAPFSRNYDVGGGKPFTLAYVMKRIPKGWIFRSYPKPFECIIEGPDYEVFRAQTFNEQPTLPVIAKISMAASTEKYGGAGNDRIWQQRL